MKVDCCFTNESNWFRYRVGAIIVEDGCVLFVGNSRDNYLYSVGGGVHMNETAQEAIVREVFEETGVHYEIERLAVIHENFFKGEGPLADLQCHEISFYFLMKPCGNKEMHCESYALGDAKEELHWLPIEELDKYTAYPTFMKDYLQNPSKEIVHIVTRE